MSRRRPTATSSTTTSAGRGPGGRGDDDVPQAAEEPELRAGPVQVRRLGRPARPGLRELRAPDGQPGRGRSGRPRPASSRRPGLDRAAPPPPARRPGCISSSCARSTSARPPRAATSAASSSVSRVLPMPGSPSTTATRPSAPMPSYRATSDAQLVRPTDEGWPPRRRLGRVGWRGDGRGRVERAAVDGVVQRRGLGQRRDAELAGQRPHALAVLRQRRGPVTGEGVQPDQRPVRGLVQRVGGEPPAHHLRAPRLRRRPPRGRPPGRPACR